MICWKCAIHHSNCNVLLAFARCSFSVSRSFAPIYAVSYSLYIFKVGWIQKIFFDQKYWILNYIELKHTNRLCFSSPQVFYLYETILLTNALGNSQIVNPRPDYSTIALWRFESWKLSVEVILYIVVNNLEIVDLLLRVSYLRVHKEDFKGYFCLLLSIKISWFEIIFSP